MKYLTILLLSFLFVSPALAAKAVVPKTVQGTIPQVQPLQPAPAGVSGAFNKNIEYKDPSYVAPLGSTKGGANPATVGGQASQNSSAVFAPKSAAGHGSVVWWLAALLVALIVGFFVYKNSKTQ